MIRLRICVSLATAWALALPASFSAAPSAFANQNNCAPMQAHEGQLDEAMRPSITLRKETSGPEDSVALLPSGLCKHAAKQRENLIRHYQENQKTGKETVDRAATTDISDDEARAILTARAGSHQQRAALRQMIGETHRLREFHADGQKLWTQLADVEKRVPSSHACDGAYASAGKRAARRSRKLGWKLRFDHRWNCRARRRRRRLFLVER